jgi:hypothetical protein
LGVICPQLGPVQGGHPVNVKVTAEERGCVTRRKQTAAKPARKHLVFLNDFRLNRFTFMEMVFSLLNKRAFIKVF